MKHLLKRSKTDIKVKIIRCSFFRNLCIFAGFVEIVGCRPMAGHAALDRRIGVRIPATQHGHGAFV